MHYHVVDQASLKLLEQARDRLIESAAELRSTGENGSAAAVHEALSHVLPNLPGLIEAKLTKAHAQIYTREQLQALLTRFAVDVLTVQGDCLLEAVEHRRRARRRKSR